MSLDPATFDRLAQLGADVHEVSPLTPGGTSSPPNPLSAQAKRGGQMTYHGPGQLVGYPIVRVEHHGVGSPSLTEGWYCFSEGASTHLAGQGVRCYVDKLEETLIQTCAEYGIQAGRSPHTGVWVEDGKIGAIGELQNPSKLRRARRYLYLAIFWETY